MRVKKFFLLLTVFTSTFSFASFVWADGGHSNHSEISNAITNLQGTEQQPSGDPHSNINHGDSHEDPTNNHNDDHSTDDHNEKQGHSDLGHGEDGYSDNDVIEETPPNYKVLGAFGLINMSFLGLGLIKKLRRRKGSPYEAIK